MTFSDSEIQHRLAKRMRRTERLAKLHYRALFYVQSYPDSTLSMLRNHMGGLRRGQAEVLAGMLEQGELELTPRVGGVGRPGVAVKAGPAFEASATLLPTLAMERWQAWTMTHPDPIAADQHCTQLLAKWSHETMHAGRQLPPVPARQPPARIPAAALEIPPAPAGDWMTRNERIGFARYYVLLTKKGLPRPTEAAWWDFLEGWGRNAYSTWTRSMPGISGSSIRAKLARAQSIAAEIELPPPPVPL